MTNSRSQGTESSSFKYRYMKWQRKFFDDHKMRTVFSESQEVTIPLGVFAQYLFIRLMNESIAHEGILRYDDETPYTPELISRTFALDQKNVELALSVLEKDRLIRWDSDKNLILQYAMDSIGQKTGTTSTERVRKWRASQKVKRGGNTGNADETKRNGVSCVSRNGCNDIIKNKEEEKEKEFNPPIKPPQGGADVRADDEGGSSGEGALTTDAAERTNGASGFAKPKPRPKGQDEYPMDRLLKAYDEASIQTGGNMPKENREAFCRYVYVNALLENDRRTGNLPGRLRGLYQKWIADGGPHMDAPPITREELAEWVRGYNPDVREEERITPEIENGFWAWLVAVGFKNGKGLRMTKWNIGGTISAWAEKRRRDMADNTEGKDRHGRRESYVHMNGQRAEARDISF